MEDIYLSPMTDEQVATIIESYGTVLEEKAKAPMFIADESKLPFPKDQIKNAILLALLISKERKVREYLKVAYLELVMWQMGVGDEDVQYGYLVSGHSLDDRPEYLAKDLLNDDDGMDDSWMSVIMEERNKLKLEIDKIRLSQYKIYS